MKTGGTIRARFGGILSAALAVLLSLQFAFMHAPSPAASGAEGIELVICSGDGIQTITLDLADGTRKERPSGPQGSKCPLCVVGAALVFDHPDRPLATAEFHAVRYPLAAQGPAQSARPCRTRAIRAPPLTI